MADNEVIFVGDSSSLEKAQERIVAGNEKISKSTEGTVKASRQAAAEERKRLTEAAKLIKDNETAQERANRKIKEAEDLYRQEKISLEVLNREKARQQQILAQVAQQEKENSAEFKAAAESQKKADEDKKRRDQERLNRRREAAKEEAELNRRVTADLAKIQGPAQRYVEKLKEWKTALQANVITQEQFNRLKNAELAKLNETVRANTQVASRVRDLNAATKEGSGATETMTGKLMTMGATLITLPALFAAVTAESQKFEESLERTNFLLDERARKLGIQGGLSEDELVAVQRKVIQAARDNGETVDVAHQAATEMESLGFPKPQETGALDDWLKVQAGSNFKGMSPKQALEGLSSFFQSYGMERNGENLVDMGVRMRGLADTKTQFEDLNEISKVAPLAAMLGIPVDDLISGYSVVKERLPPGESSTGLGNTLQSLSTAGASKKKRDALKELGLKPTDIDLQGETLTEALSTLRDRFKEAKPERRPILMAELFGKEKTNATSAALLMNNVEEIEKYNRMQTDSAGFEQAVNVAQSGPNAAKNRIEAQRQLRALGTKEQDTLRALQKQQLEAMDEEGFKNGNFFMKSGRWISNTFVRNPLIGLGVNRDHFLSDQARAEVEKGLEQSEFSLRERQERREKKAERQRSKTNFEETFSRPGFEDLPPVNERGSYEGTVRDMGVSSTMDPRGLETALTAAMTKALDPMLQELRQLRTQSATDHRQDLQAMQQQTSAIQGNRPTKISPLSMQDRHFRESFNGRIS